MAIRLVKAYEMSLEAMTFFALYVSYASYNRVSLSTRPKTTELTRRNEKMIHPTKTHLAMANLTSTAQSDSEHFDWIALVHCTGISQQHREERGDAGLHGSMQS